MVREITELEGELEKPPLFAVHVGNELRVTNGSLLLCFDKWDPKLEKPLCSGKGYATEKNAIREGWVEAIAIDPLKTKPVEELPGEDELVVFGTKRARYYMGPDYYDFIHSVAEGELSFEIGKSRRKEIWVFLVYEDRALVGAIAQRIRGDD
jgi:hypothetical protein